MIALDTNLLVYAHREDSPWHEPALRLVTALAEASAAWAIPWPSIHEFLAIVSHPRIYAPPTPLASALEQVDAWLESPSLVMIGEAEGYWLELRRTLETSRATGPKVPDARIAALCAHHGVPRTVERGPRLQPVRRSDGREPPGAAQRLRGRDG